VGVAIEALDLCDHSECQLSVVFVVMLNDNDDASIMMQGGDLLFNYLVDREIF